MKTARRQYGVTTLDGNNAAHSLLAMTNYVWGIIDTNTQHAHAHTHAHTYIFAYICVYIHTYIHIDTYIHTYIYTYIHIYIHIYIHTYTNLYISLSLYVYVYTYIYTHTHTQTHGIFSRKGKRKRSRRCRVWADGVVFGQPLLGTDGPEQVCAMFADDEWKRQGIYGYVRNVMGRLVWRWTVAVTRRQQQRIMHVFAVCPSQLSLQHIRPSLMRHPRRPARVMAVMDRDRAWSGWLMNLVGGMRGV